jgi:hypothetical protein
MNGRSRTVIRHAATDPLFSNESRGVLMRANVRSVQSTPLIDPQAKFVGMVSTHYSRVGSYDRCIEAGGRPRDQLPRKDRRIRSTGGINGLEMVRLQHRGLLQYIERLIDRLALQAFL